MLDLTINQLLELITELEPDLSVYCLRSNTQYFGKFNSLLDANATEWCFINAHKYAKHLSVCKASGIVLSAQYWDLYKDYISCPNIIICPYPHAFFALSTQIIQSTQSITVNKHTVLPHHTAIIAPNAKIGNNVLIGPYVTIAANVVIGDNCIIHSHCTIGERVNIGNNTVLYSNVNIYSDVTIDKQCIIHSGTVIGSDGFGFASYENKWIKIPHLGCVTIAEQVEIGANCTIDKGTLFTDFTIIGKGTKLDNLIQVAHNVHIGENCVIASGVGIAGSAVIGNRVQIGGKAGILGHLSICDDTIISSFTLVTKSIKKPAFYTGVYPIQENHEWEKNAVTLKKLFNLKKEIEKINSSQFSNN